MESFATRCLRKKATMRSSGWWTGSSILALIMATMTNAAPLVTDCPNGSCDMQELLDGSSITIGDKLFHNFRNFVSTAEEGGNPLLQGLPLVAGNIGVTSQEDLGVFGVAGEIGLLFDFGIANPAVVILGGGNTLSIQWEYDVTVGGGNNAIVDNTLMFPGGGIFQGAMLQNSADTSNGASLQVLEEVRNSAGEVVVRKPIMADAAGNQQIAHRDFGPHSSLHIITTVSSNAGGVPGAQVQLEYLVQSFSQQAVPEPPTMVLLGAAIAGIWALSGKQRRRRLQS